jgi:hypothetical protein
MILLAILILISGNRMPRPLITKWEWWVLILGSLVVIVSYTEEYVGFMLKEFSLSTILTYSDPERLLAYATGFIPEHFKWWIYLAGQCLFFLVLVTYSRRVIRSAGREQFPKNEYLQE